MATEEQQQQDEPASSEPMPGGERMTVDLADAAEPDDDDKGQAASPEDRKGRRRQWREANEERTRQRETITRLERQIAQLEARSQQAPQYVQAPQQQQQGTDPTDAEIEDLWNQQQMALRVIQSAQGQADVEKASEQWRKLEGKRQKLMVKQAVAEAGGNQPRGPSTGDVEAQILQSEYPEVFANDSLRLRAQAEMIELARRHGKPWGLATAREACERISPKKRTTAPSPADQARYTSVASRAGASGGSSGGYTPSTLEMRTARAYTKHLPDLSDEERFSRWYRDVGKKGGLVKSG